MTYALITPPDGQVLSLNDVKAHLRIDGEHEDSYLASLIVTACDYLQWRAGLSLLLQHWCFYLDEWPSDGIIKLAKTPVQSIEVVRVYDAQGEPEEISLEDHLLNGLSRPARLWLRNKPQTSRAMNGIEIEFTTGFGESGADVPDTLKRAMLIHTAHMYAFRGVLPASDQPASVPIGYESLIAPFCRRGL